jgi:peptidyl-prolyl cis-trans isomerase B (cyclophilin B)
VVVVAVAGTTVAVVLTRPASPPSAASPPATDQFATDTPTDLPTDSATDSSTDLPTDSPTGSPTDLPTGTATAALSMPDKSLAQGRTWAGTIATSAGDIQVSLDGAAAPQAVANFVYLAQQGFFDGVTCHRLTTSGIYVLQCGDPKGNGTGGPGYNWGPIENAPADNVYPAGTLAMARARNEGISMGSQFFIVYQDSTIPSDSAGGYTVFGQVTSGLDAVKTVAAAGTDNSNAPGDGAPLTPVTMTTVTVN